MFGNNKDTFVVAVVASVTALGLSWLAGSLRSRSREQQHQQQQQQQGGGGGCPPEHGSHSPPPTTQPSPTPACTLSGQHQNHCPQQQPVRGSPSREPERVIAQTTEDEEDSDSDDVQSSENDEGVV